MPQILIGTLEKRLETIVAVDGDVIIIKQENENPDEDAADYVNIKVADLDAFVTLLGKALALAKGPTSKSEACPVGTKK